MTYQTDQKCLCCIKHNRQVTFHHLKSRGASGTDDEWNLMPLCQEHHNMIHMKGLNYMSEKFTRAYRWLKTMGYEKCPITNKWVRYE